MNTKESIDHNKYYFVRIKGSIYQLVAEQAEKEDRSLGNMVNVLLREALATRKQSPESSS